MRSMLASSLLLSSMLIPAVAHASSPKDDAAVLTPAIRVSTGVTAPVLKDPLSLIMTDSFSSETYPVNQEVGLTLTVDPSGQASNVKIVKSANPYWDAVVVDAVEKSHFLPGTLDNRPVALDMNLTVTLSR